MNHLLIKHIHSFYREHMQELENMRREKESLKQKISSDKLKNLSVSEFNEITDSIHFLDIKIAYQTSFVSGISATREEILTSIHY